MTEVKYVAIDNNGNIVLEENTFKMAYKWVSSFNRKHKDMKLKIAKKITTTTTTIETMERPH